MGKLLRTAGAFLASALICALAAESREIRIQAGTDGIARAARLAAAGDTLLLVTGGVYRETAPVDLPAVPLTLMAAPALPTPPMAISDSTRHLNIYHNLTVKGIYFNGRDRTDYAIRSSASRPNKIVIEDCEIAYFAKDGITDNDMPVDSCIVRNTAFHDIGLTALEFRTDDMCRSLLVENCTFYRLGEHAVHISQRDTPVTVRIRNITIHDCLGGIYFLGIDDGVMSNSIITNARAYAVRAVRFTRPPVISHVVTFRTQKDFDDHPGGDNCIQADPLYFDAAAGDFSLLPGSPCLTAGSNGGPVGDLWWTGKASVRAGRRHFLNIWGLGIGTVLLAAGIAYVLFFYLERWIRKQEEKKALKRAYEELEMRVQERTADLRNSEDRYRSVVEQSADCIFLVDVETRRVIQANPALQQLLGYTEDEILSLTLYDFIAHDRADVDGKIQHILAERMYFIGERQYRRKDGALADVEVNASLISYGDRETFCVVSRDIGERKRITEALRESEERYRLLVESSPNMVLLGAFSPDCNLVVNYINSAGVRLLGAERPEQIFRRFPADFVHPDCEAAWGVRVERACRGERVGPEELRFVRLDGTAVEVEVQSVPLSYRSQSAVLMIARDITERKHAEDALHRSEETNRALLNAIPDLMFRIRGDGTFLDCRSTDLAFKGLFLPPDEFIGKNLSDIMPADMVEPAMLALEQVFRTGSVETFEYRLPMAGVIRHYEARLAACGRDEAMAIVRDITQRKRAEQAREQAERELKEQRARSIRSDRLRSLGEMAAGIAHELNQPLVGVRGLAEHTLIGMDRGWNLPEAKLKDRLGNIIEQADRMVHIIQHVRMFAREAGEYGFSPVQANDVVHASLDLLGAQFRSHGLELETDLAERLPHVQANPYSLEEVVLNLLSNARDAIETGADDGSARGRVLVRTALNDRGSVPEVRIEVVDNGPGIPEDIRAKVFDPFFTTKDPDKGTGLGLSISKSIVETFGGRIDIRSTPGERTTVTVTLPAGNKPADACLSGNIGRK